MLRDIIDLLLPVTASPALVLFLRLVPFLDLKRMANWNFDPDASKFVVSAVAAIFAYERVRKRKRKWLLGIGLVVFLVCLGLYAWVSAVPPSTESKNTYDNVAFVSFFGYYFALGYCLAHVCKFFTQR